MQRDHKTNHSATQENRPQAKVLVITAAAALTAAAVGIGTYIYLVRRATNPQNLLDRCREAIEQIERSIDFTAHA